MLTSFTLGLRQLFSQEEDNGARRFSLFIASCLASLILLGGFSAINGLNRQNLRDSARVASANLEGKKPTFLWSPSTLIFDHHEFAVISIEPLVTTAPLPLGVSAWPHEGEAVLSPAAYAKWRIDKRIQTAFPTISGSPITSEGLRNPGEVLIYFRPKSHLTSHPSVVESRKYGAPSGTSVLSEPYPPNSKFLIAGWVLMALTPALLIVVFAASSSSDRRKRRSIILGWLGLSRRSQVSFLCGESFALGLPGLLFALLVHMVAIRTLIPHLFGELLQPNDTAVSIGQYLSVLTILILVVAVSITTSELVSARKSTRTIIESAKTKLWHSAVLITGALVVTLSRLVPEILEAYVFLIGTICVTIGLVLWTPRATRAICSLLYSHDDWRISMASSRILHSPTVLVKSFAGILVALYLAIVGISLGSRLSTQKTRELITVNQWTTLVGTIHSVNLTRDQIRVWVDEKQTSELTRAVLMDGSGGPSTIFLGSCKPERHSFACPSTDETLGTFLSPDAGLTLRLKFHGLDPTQTIVRPGFPAQQDLPRTKPIFFVKNWIGVDSVRTQAFSNFSSPFVWVWDEERLIGAVSHAGQLHWFNMGFGLTIFVACIAFCVALVEAATRRRQEYHFYSQLGASRSNLATLSFIELCLPAFIGIFTTFIFGSYTASIATTFSNTGRFEPITYLEISIVGLMCVFLTTTAMSVRTLKYTK